MYYQYGTFQLHLYSELSLWIYSKSMECLSPTLPCFIICYDNACMASILVNMNDHKYISEDYSIKLLSQLETVVISADSPSLMPNWFVPPPLFLHLLPYYLQIPLNFLFATWITSSFPHRIRCKVPKILCISMTHPWSLWSIISWSIKSHDHLLCLQKLFFIVIW